MDLRIFISPRATFRVLTVLVLALTLASVVGQYVNTMTHDISLVTKFVKLFDVGSERNIPTYYASSALLACSVLLATIAFSKMTLGAPSRLHWSALSIIFFVVIGRGRWLSRSHY